MAVTCDIITMENNMYTNKDAFVDALAGIMLVTCFIASYIVATAADLAVTGM